MVLDLTGVRAVLLDMDGVLWRGDAILPGVTDFFGFCQREGIAFAFATNNSTKTVAMYTERLNLLAIPARPEQVITSAVATAEYVAQRYPPDTPVYVIGGPGIREGLLSHGFREDPDRAQLVVVGMDTSLTYDKLKIAALRIRAGATFIGTNGDRSFPLPEGLAPGAGSILAAIETATDVKPVVIGKPEAAMYDVALQRLGTRADETLMVGDRLETDILGGNRAGMVTALVLTGIATEEQAASSAIQADAAFDSLVTLHAAWEAVRVR